MRRQAVRYQIHHPIEVSVAHVRHHVHSQDLSRTGMFLPITEPLGVGTIVKLAMPGVDQLSAPLRGATRPGGAGACGQKRLHTRGTIVRVDPAGVGIALREPCEPADELFGIGIEQLVRRCTAAQLTRPANQPAVLAGELSVIGLPAILTMLEHERQTGRLLLIASHVLWIDVAEGRIVDAGMAELMMPAHAAVMMALDQRRGRFEFVPCEPESNDLGLMPITHLLLEHARRTDEARAIA